jgi:hypothetical protein
LSAYVQIMLAVGDVEMARTACGQLEEIAQRRGSDLLGAMSAHARGAEALAEGDAQAALVVLRHAWRVWQELVALYEVARARVLVALACRAPGDADTAALELEAARGVFAQLGAAPDLCSVDSLTRRASPADSSGSRRVSSR